MAVKVRWLDGGSYSAEDDRSVLQTICSIPGVVNSGDLKVTQHSTGNQTVDVATGFAFVKGTLGTTPAPQYVYQLENGTLSNIAVPTADGSLQTNHIVIARVYDNAFDALGFFKGTVELVPGTPGAGDPSIPADSLSLARIRQAAGDNVINTADIDDLRQRWLAASYMSLGIVADYERTTDTATANSATEVLVGTVPVFTALTGRFYSVSVSCSVQSTVANDRPIIRVRDGSIGGTLLANASVICDLANTNIPAYTSQRSNLSAGVHTLYVTVARYNGTGVVKGVGSVSIPFQVLVRDEGDV